MTDINRWKSKCDNCGCICHLLQFKLFKKIDKDIAVCPICSITEEAMLEMERTSRQINELFQFLRLLHAPKKSFWNRIFGGL